MIVEPPFRRRCFLAVLALAIGLALALLGKAAPTGAQTSSYSGDTVVLQGGGGEVYIAGLPPGWNLGFQEATDIGHHLEWVPRGQEAKNWRDMIAYQLFPNLIDKTPDQFLNLMADHYAGSCDQVLATDVEDTPTNGYKGALRVLACTRNTETGLGEVTLFRAVLGDKAFYVVQRAWRMNPFSPESIPVTGAQLDAGRKLIEYGIPCNSVTPGRPCPPGWDPVIAQIDVSQPTVIFPAK